MVRLNMMLQNYAIADAIFKVKCRRTYICICIQQRLAYILIAVLSKCNYV